MAVIVKRVLDVSAAALASVAALAIILHRDLHQHWDPLGVTSFTLYIVWIIPVSATRDGTANDFEYVATAESGDDFGLLPCVNTAVQRRPGCDFVQVGCFVQ